MDEMGKNGLREFKILENQQHIQHTHDLSAEGAKADPKNANV